MKKDELKALKDFMESKQHHKSNLTDILYAWREFNLIKPWYLETYPEWFISRKIDKDSVYLYWKREIVGWEIWSQWRYKVDFISRDSRWNVYLYSVWVDDFIQMTLAWKIILE